MYVSEAKSYEYKRHAEIENFLSFTDRLNNGGSITKKSNNVLFFDKESTSHMLKRLFRYKTN